MNATTVAVLFAGLLAAGWQSAAPSPSTAGERVETGQFRSDDGRQESYRIRLLPVSSFPQMPDLVASQLERMHCMIPQSFEAQQPENVIEGAFRAPDSTDWAALCSVDGTTTLYVFFAGHYNHPESLRSQADTLWLGAEPGSTVYGSAWGIAVRRAADLRALRALHRAAEFDHDGIEDAHLERSATVHYWQAGQFLALSGHD
jgi:hypothetical protein